MNNSSRINEKSSIHRQHDDWDDVHNQLVEVQQKGFLQKKSLDISDPGDGDEKEADEVARKVAGGESASIHGTGGTLNRKGEGSAETTPEFQSKLESSKGGGQPLDDSTRSEMESKIGADFSGVKIHTGGESNQMSESINAKAFTHGQDVYFKDGHHNPSSSEGKELMAHELVHTVQQSGGAMRKIQRVDDPKEATGPIAQYRDGLLTLKEFVGECVTLLKASKDSVLITILGKLSYVEGKNVAIVLYEDYLKIDPSSVNLITIPLAKKMLTVLQDYLRLEGEKNLSALQLQLCKDMIVFLELKTANETKDPVPLADPYTVVIDGTSVKVTVTVPGKTVTTKEKSILLDTIRDYLTTEYNWNALIRIMKFLDNEYDNPDNFIYTYPTSIKGGKDDSKIVLPDEGLKYLIKRQTKAAVAGKTISATNVDSILKSIDGKAAGGFAKLMGLADMNALRNESTNTDKKDIYNKEIVGLDFTKDEATIYDTLRSLVVTRNGMWSDTDKVINMIAVRRKMGTTEGSTTDPQAEFNDTIAIAWREPSGTGFVKHVRHFMATTMSGDMDKYRNIVPSTVTIKPGTHASKAPVFRTEKILTDKGGTKQFDKTDANGINVHMGSNEFSAWDKHNMSGSLPASLASIGINDEAGFQAWLILAKAVGLVHKWQLQDDVTGYDTMVELDKGKVTFDSSDATNFTVKKGSETSSYSMASARSATVGHWLVKKGGRNKIAEILAFADSSFSQPANFSKMPQAELEALFTNERIVAIVKQQAKYAIKKAEANGQAKDDFIKIMHGDFIEITDALVSDAKTDKTTFDQLMTDSQQYTPFNDNLRTYIKGIKGTLEPERKYMKNDGSLTKSPSKSPTSDYNVGGWSVACQVILGNGEYYEFQMQTLAFANETGQRRWYYTLIDESSIKVPTTAQGTIGN